MRKRGTEKKGGRKRKEGREQERVKRRILRRIKGRKDSMMPLVFNESIC